MDAAVIGFQVSHATPEIPTVVLMRINGLTFHSYRPLPWRFQLSVLQDRISYLIRVRKMSAVVLCLVCGVWMFVWADG